MRDRWMYVIILLFGIAGIFHGERIAGFGYDGRIYGDVAIRFYDSIFRERAADKRVQRCLPSAVIHYSLRALRVSLNQANVVRAFQFFNLILLLVSAALYSRISDLLGLTRGARWMGFFGLFINFAILKMPFYYPVLTDTAGFFLGMSLLYFFLTGSVAGIYVTALAGFFTWPALPFYAFFLLLFGNNDRPVAPAGRRVFAPVSLSMTAALSGVLNANLFFNHKSGVVDQSTQSGISESLIHDPFWLVLSIWLSLFFIFIAACGLLADGRLYRWRVLLKNFRIGHFLAMGLLFMGASIFFKHFSDPGMAYMTRGDYLYETVRQSLEISVKLPIVFVLSHIVYFGPVVYLLLFYWKDFCGVLRAYGLGLTLCFLAALYTLLPNSESRQLMDFFPFFVIFCAKAINHRRWSAVPVILFGLFCLFSSKIWLNLNDGNGARYFMNFGPWMTRSQYVLQGAAALLSGAVFWFYLRLSDKFRNPENTGSRVE